MKQKKTAEYDLFADYSSLDEGNLVVGAVTQVAKKIPVDESKKIFQRIEDFGEKIGGARKDLYAAYCDMIKVASENEIEEVPLSKSFPMPNYKKMLESGMESWKVDAVRALRDAIPIKPRRYSWKIREWAEKVSELRSMSVGVLENQWTAEEFREELEKMKRHESEYSFTMKDSRSIAQRVEDSMLIYQVMGHDQDCSALEFVELEKYDYGYSLCVSTQVGCKMGCNFCASAIAGFVRSLEPSEILMQIYETERNEGVHISRIVLMGIGEPLDNFGNVVRFLSLISDKEGTDLSLRHVTLSTCGIVPRIYELADMRLGLTLSVSLHCADNDKRSEIMPVNRTYDISELLDACRYYVDKTGRRVTFEYAVIDDVNSSDSDADKLAALLRGMNCHVNLIPVNKVRERSYHTARSGVKDFAARLEKRGINATVRRTLGADIEAACGQLRRDAHKQNKNGGEQD